MKVPGIKHRVLLAAVAGFAIGCASAETRPAPPLSMPLPEALARLGSARTHEGAGSTEVVLLMDRHAVGPGIFYVDEELRAFQRDQHAVVSYLVARGFALLGCEHTLGPIPRNDAARDHLEVIAEARRSGDDLNRWSVYQPLRYEVEFQGRLEVVGVEDPALYQQDLDTLERIEKVLQALRFDDAGGPDRPALEAEQARLLRLIRANVDARGRLAAANLLDLMRQSGREKAILMLGASHIPAASAQLRDASVRHHVFEAPTFRRRSAP
jgi:hypothetical protein